jgi:hypothetical protein
MLIQISVLLLVIGVVGFSVSLAMANAYPGGPLSRFEDAVVFLGGLGILVFLLVGLVGFFCLTVALILQM